MTNMPKHPKPWGRANRAPDVWHQTAATTRQWGQHNTSHTNTEVANKKHPTQNGRPTQMQTPGQHRQMYAPQTNEPRSPRPARQLSRPSDAPPCLPPCPRERRQPSKQKGGTEHTAKRPVSPQRRRTTNIHPSQAETTAESPNGTFSLHWMVSNVLVTARVTGSVDDPRGFA
ncbi:hypothetical protein ILYODFUR_023473 [Ilyodon furcidens]|uniref:Uncharacterized protein n=1 Tax=Ilyodon furcidens TaxID=33524 RepID=A0ABV0TYS3_9TELE